ncbi:hypothetical protein G4B88_021796 [Cannabis sativa]|uniref:Fe2OG dioxygenase domain-containing protein n=1 Tax=Cannabis sativa TaxID=3483 RepID=A0A7J6F511_CANSA|nr:hypothetical protein G4B88_021796 [Cannabis sativa]
MAPTLANITSTTEPSKVTEFVIHKGFGVKGLSEAGLRSLPKQYIQPIQERAPDRSTSGWPCGDELLEYMKKTETVIKKLLEVLMKRLNVTKIDKEKESALMGSKRINLNYYPICPNPDLTVGVGRHSDVSTLTILLQDEIGGLYVKVEEEEETNNNNNWVHVPPMKGSLVINIGDALQIMSNGRYKSVEHRVVANGKSDRISVPIFVNPRPSDLIAPFPQVLANGEKALYKQVLYSDYVKHFFRKAHDGKQTVDFAKI